MRSLEPKSGSKWLPVCILLCGPKASAEATRSIWYNIHKTSMIVQNKLEHKVFLLKKLSRYLHWSNMSIFSVYLH